MAIEERALLYVAIEWHRIPRRAERHLQVAEDASLHFAIEAALGRTCVTTMGRSTQHNVKNCPMSAKCRKREAWTQETVIIRRKRNFKLPCRAASIVVEASTLWPRSAPHTPKAMVINATGSPNSAMNITPEITPSCSLHLKNCHEFPHREIRGDSDPSSTPFCSRLPPHPLSPHLRGQDPLC